jgi:D-glycero-alpha-D-manno-heptose-7-phosphate kinase
MWPSPSQQTYSGGVHAVIEASAPVRICDNGGWTDTWFGGPGRVVNIAVTPGAEVSIRATAGPDAVLLSVESFGDRYPIVPGASRVSRHPLLEAAIDALSPPADLPVEVSVRSVVPAGCGAGTSAAVAVALLGGLAAARIEQLSPRDVAYAAHRLEVDVLRVESGIQDQLSAAFGGINYLEIDRYPEATVHPLPAWDELGARLTLVFLGRAHDSSDVHRQVIENVGTRGSKEFSRLRAAAVAARDAVLAVDLEAFGQAMIANTEAQDSLHPALVGADARRVIEIAAAQRALGWKVNGAGGEGGSLTILSATAEAKTAVEARVAALDTRYRVLPIQVSSVGLQVRGALSYG